MAKVDLITPLFTADATKEARYVEGTGLVGSLRWWYEAIVRGLDGWACAPAGDGARCGLDAKGFAGALQVGCEHLGSGKLCPSCETGALAQNGLCVACRSFGATGWARRFSLTIRGTTSPERPFGLQRDRVQAGRRNHRGGSPGYYFPKGQIGHLDLGLLPRRPGDADIPRLLLGLLEFVRINGGLGAKTNLGYGLIQWAGDSPPDALPGSDEFASMVKRRIVVEEAHKNKQWPDLREMFFAEIALSEPWNEVRFVNLKWDLRTAFREGEAIEKLVPNAGARRRLRHFLLGTTGTNPNQGSKIKMGVHPDGRTLRVWGWVPPWRNDGVSREEIVKLIYRQLATTGTVGRWREFDSPRDTERRFQRGDEQAYLGSLMEEARP